ncbi:MAG: nucleoside hydrolase, partial [Clostridia bacterium]|nr:nucleoside hydrolase [Clostridia bacterium]
MKIPVFIDCDPGIDDMIALLLAEKMPELDVVGIGTVCGNVESDKTYTNALKAVAFTGSNTPVFKGADAPMFGELVTAKYVHGEDGLSGLGSKLSTPDIAPEKEKAWDALYRLAKEYKGELVLVAVGPLTNIAIALSKYKELPSLLKKIVIMGGSAAYGNITPAAEFNIYVDPEAAHMVFECGCPI